MVFRFWCFLKTQLLLLNRVKALYNQEAAKDWLLYMPTHIACYTEYELCRVKLECYSMCSRDV